MQPQMMKLPKQDISSLELELYLGHLSTKAALFGWVQASWGQHKVWQRQIKLLYQPREAEAAGIHVVFFSAAFHPILFIYLFILFAVSLQGADGGINIHLEGERFKDTGSYYGSRVLQLLFCSSGEA